MNLQLKQAGTVLGAGILALSCAGLTGCETREKVLEIETPSGEIEVLRDPVDGSKEVEITD